MTPVTFRIINQLGFCHTREELLFQAYVRLSANRILGKTGIIGKLLYPFLLPAFFLINFIQQFRMFLIVRLDNKIKMEIRERIDDEISDFTRRHQKNDFLQRSQEDFIWIEKNPWLIKRSDDQAQLGGRYPFSYHASDFCWEWLVSRRDDSITSVILTSRREGNMKVLYYFGDHLSDGMEILRYKIYRDKGIKSVLLSHPALMKRIKELKPISLHKRYRTRYVGVSKKVLESFHDHMIIQMGDGDAVFT